MCVCAHACVHLHVGVCICMSKTIRMYVLIIYTPILTLFELSWAGKCELRIVGHGSERTRRARLEAWKESEPWFSLYPGARAFQQGF